MSRGAPSDPAQVFFVGVSIFGLFMTLMLATQPPSAVELDYRKTLTGSIFTVICVLGIVAAIAPRTCSGAFGSRGRTEEWFLHSGKPGSVKAWVGHHPYCQGFSAHVIEFNGHHLCAACTGLLIGGLLALLGTALYFYYGWRFGQARTIVVVTGVLGVSVGFFQQKFGGFVRSFLNVLFVIGSFLVLSGMDESAQSLSVDLFLISVIVFWLLTRILLSRWDHRRICASCGFCGKPDQKRVSICDPFEPWRR